MPRGHAIHGSYWRTKFSNPVSHSRVNVRLGDDLVMVNPVKDWEI